MDVGHIDAHLVVLLCLQALREGHGLGLHLTERVELSHGLHALIGRHDSGERAVGIVLELLYGHATAEATATRQFTRMIEEVGVALVVGYTAVVGERPRITQRHNLASIRPRTSGMRRSTIRNMFRYSTSGIEQIVGLGRWLLAFSFWLLYLGGLHQPRAFCIAILVFLATFTLVHGRRSEGLLRHVKLTQFTTIGDHVLVQLQVVALGVTPHEPCLTVIVNHHRWVDVVPRTILKQRFADGITERASRRVADGNTDSHTP